jgi:hypothetical protein
MDDANLDVTLHLTPDEALVLSEFFARFEQTDKFALRHTAEFVAFSRIAAQLDKLLVEPFQRDYQVLVEAARERLSTGFEGVAPGISGDALELPLYSRTRGNT